MKQSKKFRLNQVQLKTAAALFSEISKGVALVTIVGMAFPKIGGEIGFVGAMWLLREVKEK